MNSSILKSRYFSLVIFLTLLLLFSCEEGIEEEIEIPNQPTPFDCSRFSYEEEIFYLQEGTADYIINPVAALEGTFSSFPEDLELDPQTGAINISQSETGLKYLVSFVPVNTSDTCQFSITISGINYLDSIHVLQSNDTLAVPVYNAANALALPCQELEGEDIEVNQLPQQILDFIANNYPGETIEDAEINRTADGTLVNYEVDFESDLSLYFNSNGDLIREDTDDDDDDDDDDDEYDCNFEEDAIAGNTQLILTKGTGTINLKQTVAQGAFGVVPVSGSFIEKTIRYRLNDASQLALNQINVRLYYFDTQEEIPQTLLDELNDKKQGVLSNARVAERPTRPPYIIIVGRIQ